MSPSPKPRGQYLRQTGCNVLRCCCSFPPVAVRPVAGPQQQSLLQHFAGICAKSKEIRFGAQHIIVKKKKRRKQHFEDVWNYKNSLECWRAIVSAKKWMPQIISVLVPSPALNSDQSTAGYGWTHWLQDGGVWHFKCCTGLSCYIFIKLYCRALQANIKI